MAAIALYRPGPDGLHPHLHRAPARRESRSRYRHPSLEPILAETYGIIVYQEQIIQIARDLAGYNAGEADTDPQGRRPRRSRTQLLKHREQFVAGADGQRHRRVDRPRPSSTTSSIFARYGFNKAHAADYAVIVCQTAYLKAHYPVEYMAALLSVDRDDTAKIGQVAADCHRHGHQAPAAGRQRQ